MPSPTWKMSVSTTRRKAVRVRSGDWEVCEDVDFRGRCRTLGPGEYASLERLSNRISSVREVR
ncbi:beta/gamma crystallin-related protein [Janthinobacterium sp. PSPC2-1]|uniref:beta/gamma crystallin-related protein n=1 Tax=unclassified Janthinobacterium TaxID=2610881 RepID=UPI003CF3B6C6